MSDERRKDAIRTLLRQMVSATYADLTHRAGEGLASPLMEMVQSGELVREDDEARAFRLARAPDLGIRCAEILEWRRTGVYQGTALAGMAQRWDGEDDALRRAEDETIREALRRCAAER